jgi:hypothetical protein
MRTLPTIVLALAVAACARGAATTSAAAAVTASDATPPALAAIAESDVRRDLFVLASDSFRGREAGTLDELRASMWVADRAREAGLLPAGDDGTYFQFWPMRRVRVSPQSRIAVGGQSLTLGSEALVIAPVDATVDVPLVFVGEGREGDLANVDVRGKAVAAVISAPEKPPAANVSLRAWRYALAAIRERSQLLTQRGAVAVVLVSDSTADEAWPFAGAGLTRGRYNVDTTGAGDVPAAQAPVVWVRRALLDRVRAPNQRLTLTLRAESFVYPSVNVVARVPGSDPALRDQYVLYSGHQDHDGVRFPVNGDSIWNGADDNASVSVGLLAIGRALKQRPTRRSSLFVWHGAEERGLLGSRWFVAHPTVPREAIVAVLNADMIGRNNPDSAAILGVQPPHLNSAALARAALDANARVTKFALDTTWDRPTHPEGWYFRSDHLPYARAGIPALMFTTLLHPDYHTPRDEASRIDVAKLTRMARWMYATGWIVGNAAERVEKVAAFKLER